MGRALRRFLEQQLVGALLPCKIGLCLWRGKKSGRVYKWGTHDGNTTFNNHNYSTNIAPQFPRMTQAQPQQPHIGKSWTGGTKSLKLGSAIRTCRKQRHDLTDEDRRKQEKCVTE